MSDLHWLGVLDLARGIATKKVSPVEVLQAHLTRIEQLDGRLRSYLAVFADSALEAARAAEAAVAAGGSLPPLHGVPVAVKDLFAVAGTPTTGGSRFLTEPARADATVVARLRAAGAVILGKLNLHEFAYGPEGTNPHFGTPWNPWDATVHRLPGGSSSGSAVAVAAGLSPAALGSDTGGSIRMPAALCGVVGLKPTYGRVSRAGVLPLSWSLDHAGPLARRAADAAAILSAIAGADPADPSSSRQPVPDYVAALSGSVRGMRIGLVGEYLRQAEDEVQAAVAGTVATLERLGCVVAEVAFPTARFALGASLGIIAPEALAYHAPLLSRHAREYAPDVRQRLLVGRFLTATDYVTAQRARLVIRDDVEQALRRVDCLLTPTLPVAAPPVAAVELTVRGRVETPRSAFTMFTRLFNLTGHPAIAVPCGLSRGGLPLSCQVVGRAFDEASILRLAHAYEEATDWHARRPAVA